MGKNLKSRRISVTLPEELYQLLLIRMEEERITEESKFFLSCFLWDCIVRGQHAVTASIVNEPKDVFHKIVDEIVRDFPKRRQRMVGWLAHHLSEKGGANLQVE